jgi:hypothetical protein
MAWIALITSVVSLICVAIALVAVRSARAAHQAAEAWKRRAEERAVLDAGIPWHPDEFVADEIRQQPHISAALDDGDSLSRACHVVIRALDAEGEPPTPGDYNRVQRCSDQFTISIARMRAPQHPDIVREVSDELVTLHHCILTEIKQHQGARFPFVGARDTTLAGQVLRRFDAELARLRVYARTGSVPEPNPFPVDFETVRFVPRPTPGAPPTNLT